MSNCSWINFKDFFPILCPLIFSLLASCHLREASRFFSLLASYHLRATSLFFSLLASYHLRAASHLFSLLASYHLRATSRFFSLLRVRATSSKNSSERNILLFTNA